MMEKEEEEKTNHNSLEGRLRQLTSEGYSTLKSLTSKAMEKIQPKPALFFGVPLNMVEMRKDGIPLVVYHLIEYLRNECMDLVGIFRLSGTQTEVQWLKNKYDSGVFLNLKEELKSQNSACSLLKQYFRELPEPLLTFELYDCFIAANSTPVPEARLDSIKKINLLLPASHLILLKYLVQFLNQLSLNSEVNKMNVHNLAVVFAPNVLRPPHSGNSEQEMMALADSPHSLQILESLIENYDRFFQDLDMADLFNRQAEETISRNEKNEAPPSKFSEHRRQILFSMQKHLNKINSKVKDQVRQFKQPPETTYTTTLPDNEQAHSKPLPSPPRPNPFQPVD